MGKKLLAIHGSYRNGGIIDQAIDAALEDARASGWDVEKISLKTVPIEFCENCRKCTVDDPHKRRGACVHDDGMEALLAKIDAADALVLGSPVNFGTVTALMKRFIERMICYGRWPWGTMVPKGRIAKRDKIALVIASSSCPGFLAALLMPSAGTAMKDAARLAGAGAVRKLYLGDVCRSEKQRLSPKQREAVRAAVKRLTVGR
ncbi:MAG TPA: flavodoxin family protein [bacterium]|nr:flavodoxin family protein [bacterium]